MHINTTARSTDIADVNLSESAITRKCGCHRRKITKAKHRTLHLDVSITYVHMFQELSVSHRRV